MNLSREGILKGLKAKTIGRDIVWRETVDSTNTLAARLAEAGAAHGTLVIAGQQTQGRGTQGRSWYSPPDTSIYMSVILRPAQTVADPAVFTLVAAAAVASAIAQNTTLLPQIKWPNDILLNGKKCCGILTESRIALGKLSYYVVGIGVNVNLPAAQIPEQLQRVITSIGAEAGEPVSRVKLVQSILLELEELYELYLKEGFSPIRDIWLSYKGSEDLLNADIYKIYDKRYTDLEV